MLFRGTLVDGNYSPGPESLDCELVLEHEVPWEQLAFPVVKETLQRYYEDQRRQNGFPLQRGEITKHPARKPQP